LKDDGTHLLAVDVNRRSTPEREPKAEILTHEKIKAAQIGKMLSILRKARLKDKEMRILML
jgi:hypothetical protein